MIQDIKPEIFFNQYSLSKDAVPSPSDIVFFFPEEVRDRRIYGREENGMIHYPTVSEVGNTDLLYLFSIDSRHFYLCPDMTGRESELEALSYEPLPLKDLRILAPQDLTYAGSIAWQLFVWYRSSRYCGHCGAPTSYSDKERALVCPKCGNVIYPRINPAVIIGVRKGDSILVSRYAGRSYKGIALLAGFCEIGETAEETVQREVMEEVGIHVNHIRYYKSQPWGFDSDLLLGFYCDAVGDEELHVDHSELARARYIRRDEIEENDSPLTMTQEMLERFRQGKA